MDRIIKIWQVGNIGYTKCLRLQKHLAQLHHTEEKQLSNTLLIVEHPPVYTVGIRTKNYTDKDEERLRNLGAEFYKTNRGGLITFHGPGQMVAYPIINLKHFTPSVKWYVCHIEQTIINLCKSLGLKAETSPHTGVWINDKKVCAIGLHASRYVTTHGLALNCCTDLKWFEHIVPCGIEGKGVTSLSAELGKIVSLEEIVPRFVNSFSEIFNCQFIDFPKDHREMILGSL